MLNTKNKEQFFQYLTVEKELTNRVASNYISRCLRVERELNVCLVDSTKTVDNFVRLMERIYSYAQQRNISPESRYSLAGTLRSSVRRFAEFKWGPRVDSYPSNHRRISSIKKL